MFTGSPLKTFLRRAQRPWFLLAVLSVLWLSNSNEVRGACGDYLMVGAAHDAGQNQFQSSVLFVFPHLSSPHANSSTSPFTPSLPCRGPNCGRSPLHDASPPAVPASRDMEKLGCIDGFNFDFQVTVVFLTGCNPGPCLPAAAQEIFHPPRV